MRPIAIAGASVLLFGLAAGNLTGLARMKELRAVLWLVGVMIPVVPLLLPHWLGCVRK